MYINDLLACLKSYDCAIDIGEEQVYVLQHEDDVVLLANGEKELQIMLDALALWCEDNYMNIIPTKSNVVHFRPPSILKSDVKFTLVILRILVLFLKHL